MKKIIRVIVFLIIFILLFLLVFKVLWLQKNPITYFYQEPNNSLDVVYIGGSSVYAHFNTTLAYHEYGFKTGLMSYDSQPIITTKYLIKESQKYQKPKLYIIDLCKSVDSFSEIYDGAIRKTTDSMKFSKNRKDLIDDMLKYANVSKEEYINYYFSLFMYHDAWKDFDKIKINILGNKDLYKGYLFNDSTTVIEEQKEYDWFSESKEMPKENKEVLLDLLNYIDDNDIEVLFVIPKRIFDNDQILMLNYEISLLEDYGYNVINFNTLDDFEVDFDHDFYNFAHLNVWGATKYTLYFSKYLNDNYKFDKHKNIENNSKWVKEYDRFKKEYYNLTQEKFETFLKKVKSQY